MKPNEPRGTTPSSQLLHDVLGVPSQAATAHTLPSSASTIPAKPEPSGRYRSADVFASGGLGMVRRAFDRTLGRTVALKELRDSTQGGEGAARLMREAMLTARLEHPSIIPIYDLGTHDDGSPYYCMRLVQGRPLSALIEATRTAAERIALLPHVIAVADAMAYAHEAGVIHRDLKPDNVLVGEFGQTVVIDWGLAKAVGENSTINDPDLMGAEHQTAIQDLDLTRTGQVMGTLLYMPPEQATGSPIDERADVYAIGAILYHVLAARPPYSDLPSQSIYTEILQAPPTEISLLAPEIHVDLHAVVRKAMARALAERYLSAKDLAADLKRFQVGQLISAKTYSTREVLRRWVYHRKYQLGAGVVHRQEIARVAVGAAEREVRVVDRRDDGGRRGPGVEEQGCPAQGH